MRIRTLTLWTCVGLGLIAAGAAAGAEDVSYLKVVTKGDRVTGDGVIQYVDGGYAGYCLDEDRVVFTGSTGSRTAVFAVEHGKTRILVDSKTRAPGLGRKFQYFDWVTQDDGDTAFRGATNEACEPWWNCEGVFLLDGSGLRAVAHTKMTVPGHDRRFGSFSGTAIDNGWVAFDGLTDRDEQHEQVTGVWTDRGQGLETIADWRTRIPGSQKTMRHHETAGISGQRVYFRATNEDYEGVYLFAWDGDSIETIIDPSTTPPDRSEPLEYPHSFRVRDGTLAFVDEPWDPATQRSHRIVYADFGDGLEVIATDDEIWEQYGIVAEYIEGLAVSADTVAFKVNDGLTYDDYVYVYRDGQLSEVLSEGESLRGFPVDYLNITREVLSGDAVIMWLEDASDGEQTGIYKAVYGPTNHRILATGDMDGNQHAEIALWTLDEFDHQYRFQIRDLSSTGMSSYFKLGAEPIVDMAVFDRQAGGKRVATLDLRDNGRTAIRIRDAMTGQKTRQIDVGTGMSPRSLALLPDMDASGEPELAAMGILRDGNARIRVYDSSSKALLSKFVHRSSMNALSLLSTGDTDGTGGPELGLLLEDTQQIRGRMVIFDAQSGTPKQRLIFRQGFEPVGAITVADQNGNASPEVAFVGYRRSDGKALLQIKDTLTGRQTAKSTWTSSGEPVAVSVTPAGDQVIVLEVQSDGKSTVRLRAAADAKAEGMMQLRAATEAVDLAGTPDTNGNGAAEVAVLGEHFDLGLVEVCDGMSRDSIRYMFVP